MSRTAFSRRKYLIMCTATVFAGCNGGTGKAESTDWPMFHTDAANSGTTDSEIPTRSRDLVWRQSLEFPYTSPIVADDTVLVGDATGIRAFDVSSGSRQWRTKFEGTPGGTPAVAKDSVFVTSDGRFGNAAKASIRALGFDQGQELWRVQIDDDHVFTPTVADGTVYFRTSEGVYAFDTDGTVQWSHTDRPRFDDVHHEVVMDLAPAVAGETVFVPDPDGVIALDAGTGEIIWTASAEKVRASPAVSRDRVFLADVPVGLRAFDRSDGAERWRWDSDGGCWTTPAVTEDTVYATAGFSVVAVSPSDGTEQWRLSGDGIHGDIYSSPAVGANGVVICSSNRPVAVLRKESVVWEQNTGGSRVSPAIASGRIHVVSDEPVLLTFE
jgi:hypothetical protein